MGMSPHSAKTAMHYVVVFAISDLLQCTIVGLSFV